MKGTFKVLLEIFKTYGSLRIVVVVPQGKHFLVNLILWRSSLEM